MKKTIILNLTIVVFFFFSCGTTAPLKEKNLAKNKIQQAKGVDASFYAETDLGESENNYFEGEELINLDKNSQNNKKAKEKYLVAIEKARLAFDKSVGPYTKQYIDNLSEEIELSKEENIDKASQELFDEVIAKYNQANDNYNSQKYGEAIMNVTNAQEKLKEANELAQELREQVDIENQDIEQLIVEATAKKAEAATPDELNENLDHYDRIIKQNEKGYYSKSLEEYLYLKESFLDMFELIEEKKNLVAEENQDIEQLIVEATAKKAEAATPDELNENLDHYDRIIKQNEKGYYSKSLEEYPYLKESFLDMFELIEEKKNLAAEEIDEAEEKIENVSEQNQGLKEEINDFDY